MNGLRAELARVGIRGRLARRIELELADHERCDPSAELGSPQLIAARFAAELCVPKTRRATYGGFTALAVTALLLAVPTQGLSAAGGWPNVNGTYGTVASLGGLAMAFGGQIALVAGVLALWRILLRSHDPEELRLVQRRLGVALAAGGLVIVGLAVQALALRPLEPAWWIAVAGSVVCAQALVLGTAARSLRSAVALTPSVPAAPRAFPTPVVVAIGSGVALLMGVGSTFTEHSLSEGISRGVLEAIAFGTCFTVLGRRLGIRR